MPHASKLSRQDTLPAEEPPSWSYSSVPGQPAPIPPRNEPLLFIPNHGTAHGDASLACSSLKSINSDSETLKTSSINIINADHHSDNVTEPKLRFKFGVNLNDSDDSDILPLAAIVSLTIHETSRPQPEASGVVLSTSPA